MSDDTSSATADASPGDKVAGYRLEEKIGQGGMAVVYRAYDERLERRVALKLLAPNLTADTAFRARFIRESRAAASVDHPNIIPVYDAGDAGGFLFIAMRYVQGGDVRALISEDHPLSPTRAWNIITQVGAALDAAHARELIHRDVKPANMLLDASTSTSGAKTRPSGDDPRDHVYLSDFGISKQTLASHLTSTGQFVGTLDYIAPEQIEGQALDGRADQYALACTAFELLCGAPPFLRNGGLALINAHLSQQPPSVVTKRPELPAAVDRVFAKAMAKSPDLRYETCADFAADLGRALGLVPGQPGVAGQPAQGAARPATELAMPVTAPEQTQAASPGLIAAAAAPTMSPPAAPVPAGVDVATMAAVQPGPSGPQGVPVQPGWPGQQPGQAGVAIPGQPGAYQPPGPYQPSGPYPQYPQYPPGGPTAPQGWPQYPPPAKRSKGVLVGAVVATIVVAVAAVAIVVLVLGSKKNGSNANGNSGSPGISSTPPASTSSTTPPSTPALTARSEATSVSNVLLSMANSRSQLQAAVGDVGNCGNLSGDVSSLQQIANARSNELTSAQNLQTGLISNGGTLKSELVQALRVSLRIDNDYLAWAQQQQSSGCGSYSSALQDANAHNSQATYDKSLLVGTWDPIAASYTPPLPQYSADQI